VPLVVHVALPVDEYPPSCAIGLFLQTATVPGVVTRGAGEKVIVMLFATERQFPFPVVFNVMTTLPAVVSAGLAT
jgi:hypothetical protein